MKTEQSLRKFSGEPLAFLPDPPFQFVPAATAAPGVYADLVPSLYGALIVSWVSFLAIFVVTFASSATTMFMLALDGVYALMFFGVPLAMIRLGANERWQGPSLASFVRAKVQTLYGPVGGLDALIQVILVPACLTIGGIGIALAVAAARATYF
ncbi:MAG: hypothetical protein KGO48_11200 [Alphaproteobacteria bacterium]|nr:hypothetical protein [Alphaproteobacteria bacterium]